MLKEKSRQKPIKLLVFGLGKLDGIGGVQLSYSWLFHYLVNKNFIIRFCTHFTLNNPEHLYYPFPENVEICTYKLEETKEAREKILQIAKEFEPSVILIVNSSRAGFILSSIFYDQSYPVVFSERGGADYCLNYLWINKLQRSMAHACVEFTHMLMPSYKKSLPKFMRNQMRIIPSATQKASILATPHLLPKDKVFKILYTGRLTFEKDLDILLKAFALITIEDSAWQLRIVGEGKDSESLKKLAIQLNIEKKVLFLGEIVNHSLIQEEYCGANIFVLTSRAEGCPISLREAMAHGLPVIGFEDCSGTNEIIANNINGILVSSQNKIKSLADKLGMLMKNPSERQRLGIRASIDVKKFDPEKIHSEWKNLLLEAARYNGFRKKLLRLKRWLCAPIKYTFLKIKLYSVRNTSSVRLSYVYRYNLKDELYKLINIKTYTTLYNSVFFDPFYYLQTYTELKEKNKDPLLHYITEGWKLNNKPSEYFDVRKYAERYPNLSICPLYHYYNNGMQDNLISLFNIKNKGVINKVLEDREYKKFHKQRLSQYLKIFSKQIHVEMNIVNQ